MKVGAPRVQVTAAPAEPTATPASPAAPFSTAVAPDAFCGSPLEELALSGSITDPKVQISGMAWHGDTLLLMPQWGERLYTLTKAELTARLDGAAFGPLSPRELRVSPPGFKDAFPGFEGFEALTVVGDRAYLLAEAKEGEQMFGYLVAGRIGPDGLELDLSSARRLPCASPVNNLGYEALVATGDGLLVLPEANGPTVPG